MTPKTQKSPIRLGLMATALALPLTIGLTSSPAAADPPVNMNMVRCQELADDDFAQLTVVWLDGYRAALEGDATLKPDWMEDFGKKLAASCPVNPKQRVMGLAKPMIN